MIETIHDKIVRSLLAAEGLYYRLVLLVGESGTGKTDVLHLIAKKFGTSVINVNLALSYELLELTEKQRVLKLPELLDEIINTDSLLVVLDNLEILFDEHLRQDPLRLLQRLARKHTVVASWNGFSREGKLFYAQPGHPEYRRYDSVDALIVGTDGTSTIDLPIDNRKAR